MAAKTSTTDSKTVLVLRAARALLAEPERWTKGALARTGRGVATTPTTDFARAWCPVGAVDRAAFALGVSTKARTAALVALGAVVWERGCLPLVEWNDNPRTTHADVLAVFDAAIAAAQAADSGE